MPSNKPTEQKRDGTKLGLKIGAKKTKGGKRKGRVIIIKKGREKKKKKKNTKNMKSKMGK